MIERLKDFPDNVLALACHGFVSKVDYDTVVVPAVNEVLKRHEKVRLYYETAADFAGIEPGAVFKDFKIGMEHLTRWERMAVVTDINWIKYTVQFFSFMMPGELQIFPRSECASARRWVIGQ